MKPQHFASEDQRNVAIEVENARISAQMTERYHERVAHTRSLPTDPSLILPLSSLVRTCNEALSAIRMNTAEQSLSATAGAALTQNTQKQLALQLQKQQ